MSARASIMILLIAALPVVAGAATPCEIKITIPQEGAQVGPEGKVRGTATIPSGSYLWVLDHMKDLTLEWWPQGRRAAVIEPDGTWVIIAAYGRKKDIGELFEVAAVVVDANTNRRLQEWVKTAKQNDYEPIEFPDAMEGCLPAKVTVKKTSHDDQ